MSDTYYATLTAERREKMRIRARELYRLNHAHRIAKQREKRAKNREAINANMRKYQRANRDKFYEYNAANRFGVKRAEIQAIRSTSAVCEICGDPPEAKRRLAIDHNHQTGKLRGMLCHTCNLGLGAFKDDVLRIHKAAMYLASRECKGEVG
jgi:hypothetical protein